MKTKYKILKDGHGHFQVKYKEAWFLPWRFKTVGFGCCQDDLNRGRKDYQPKLFRWFEDAQKWVEEHQAMTAEFEANWERRKRDKKLERQLELIKKIK